MEIKIKAGHFHGKQGVWVAARPVGGGGWRYWRFDTRSAAISHARGLARDFGGTLRTAQVLPLRRTEELA